MAEARRQFCDCRGLVFGRDDLARLVWLNGCWGDYLGRRESTALGYIGAHPARVPLSAITAGGRSSSRVRRRAGNIENIQLPTSGGLGGEFLGGIVRDMVAIDDVLLSGGNKSV